MSAVRDFEAKEVQCSVMAETVGSFHSDQFAFQLLKTTLKVAGKKKSGSDFFFPLPLGSSGKYEEGKPVFCNYQKFQAGAACKGI